MVKTDLEVWGYNTYRPFRIYWILHGRPDDTAMQGITFLHYRDH